MDPTFIQDIFKIQSDREFEELAMEKDALEGMIMGH